ncbi:ABC-2 type transport system permease protein [Geodermatophilus saharensis]|uniref:Transport permease protein n=1 Tax=Geodermatophilus saharensis TaxID=1137994 RepID=A0A239DJL2_9ACTN|nr:ABC transporter permease [Geodermatophilus saharensis]SNS32048.1 ABC-2 type transport system permease protein [Geodermatophilus saharensis]
MTATQSPPRATTRPQIDPPSLLRASATIVWRNLIHIRRMPEMLLDVTVQSVMFVLLFAYVFGGAIAVAGSNYREFLLPGIMVQTMVFSSAIVAMGLTNDLQKGFVDRFKSLPVPRPAVLVGRSMSSLIHSSIGVAVMAVTGLLIGWRIRDGVVDGVLGFALLLLFGFAMIWLGIWVGSLMRTVEAVQGFMFTVMFPLTFVANTFAPTESMPAWLRTIAEWNPVSALTQACRDLWGNGLPAPADAAWPLQHAVAVSIAWSLLLTAVFAPLAVSAFRRRSRD